MSLLIFLMAACDKRPDNVLSDKQMVDLMVDLNLAEAYAQQVYSGAHADSMKHILAMDILATHHVSKSQLDATLVWYGHNMEKYDKLFENVDKELERRNKRLNNNPTSISISKNDDNNLWPYFHHFIISEHGNSGAANFSIEAPNLQKGDRIEWSIRFRDDSGGSVLLGVDYDNGTSSYLSYPHQGGRNFNISLQTDSSRKVTRLYGVVNGGSLSRLPIMADSVSLLKYPLDQESYIKIKNQKSLYKPRKNIFDSGNANPNETTQVEQKVKSSVQHIAPGGGSASPQSIIGSPKGNNAISSSPRKINVR